MNFPQGLAPGLELTVRPARPRGRGNARLAQHKLKLDSGGAGPLLNGEDFRIKIAHSWVVCAGMQLNASANAAVVKPVFVASRRMAKIQDMAREFLRRALEAKGWTPYRLAKECGVSATTITRPLNNPDYNFTPKLDTLLRIAAATGVPLPDILNASLGVDAAPVRGSIPVVGEVRAGAFHTIPDDPAPGEWLNMDVPDYERARLFALRVAGRSMDKFYADGTYVVAAPAAETGVRAGDHVVVRRFDAAGRAETTLKEVARRADGSIYLEPRSTDPNHQEAIPVMGDRDANTGVEIIGVVVASYNATKRGRGPLIIF